MSFDKVWWLDYFFSDENQVGFVEKSEKDEINNTKYILNCHQNLGHWMMNEQEAGDRKPREKNQ